MIDATSTLFTQPNLNQLYSSDYNISWVIISVLLAILSSYAALSASSQISKSKNTRSKLVWSLISSLILGLGTWGMHFIGMLSLHLPCQVSYNLWITIASIIPGILAGGAVFGIVWNNNIKQPPPLLGSLLLGSGIGSMHYSGMAAMKLAGTIHYDPTLFALSIFVAIILSYIALRIKQNINHHNTLIALILGSAISGMHYTAIAATYFIKDERKILDPSIFTPESLSLVVTLTTLFLIFAALTLASIFHAREITEKLFINESRFRLMIESLPDPTIFKDAQGNWLIINHAAEKLFQLQEIQWQGVNEKDLAKLNSNFSIAHHHYLSNDDDTWQAKKLSFYDKSTHNESGKDNFFEIRKVPIFNHQNKPEALLVIIRDITEQKTAEADLRIAAASFESQEGIVITDENNIILRVNPAFSEITGYSYQEVIGKSPSLLNSGRQNKAFYTDMWNRLKRTGSWSGEIWNRRKNGEIYPEQLSITAVKNQDNITTNYVATLADITMRKAASDKIKDLAFYDPLTHLPNRRLLHDRLNQALVGSSRSGKNGALLFIDLDHFKQLNDTLGHDMGDLLLQQVAKRLLLATREGDTVARFGGDEFVVLLEGLSSQPVEAAQKLKTITNKIITSLKHPYFLGTHKRHTSASIGARLFSGHEETLEAILKQADMAMYQAKESGRNTLRFFDPQMQATIQARYDLETELRLAIEEQQFRLHYQLQVDHLGNSVGVEALIRWQHPTRGMVSPFEFIPITEENGMIITIGQWVLETACQQINEWSKDERTKHLVIAVNVSAKQFSQIDFIDQVNTAVNKYAIDASKLKLELTESMLVDNIEQIITTMNILKEFGITFSLD
ncbi:MAG: diguanylate cyclase, partial [Methyloprofundus sp.]|nr:diguanylate cyclase [Methyloprofundus sp.]